MDNPISNLIERIKEVNETLASYWNGSLSFEDWYEIAQFYYDWQNTKRLMDEAERLAEGNPGQLKELAGTFKEEPIKPLFLSLEISPKDRDKFIQDLLKINPNIKVIN